MLGHERPFFTAIAAVISSGVVVGQEGRRAVELVFGVACGLAVADLLVLAIGTGTVQIGVVVALAMAAAMLLGGGALLVTEAAVSGLVAVTLQPSTQGLSPDRFLDALVGSGPGGAPSSRATLAAAYQTARLAPPRRRALGQLGLYATAAEGLDLAVRNVRVLARAAVSTLLEEKAPPEQLSETILDLARAVEALAAYIEEPEHPVDTHWFALEAAEEATAVLWDRNDLETSVMVGQIRSTAVDLLRASGMDSSAALQALREAQLNAAEAKAPVE